MNSTTYTTEQTAEHAGAIVAHDLVNELVQMKAMPQPFALKAIHDKIYALSKVQPFDNAASGFSVGLVNVLQIGVANLPEVDGNE